MTEKCLGPHEIFLARGNSAQKQMRRKNFLEPTNIHTYVQYIFLKYLLFFLHYAFLPGGNFTRKQIRNTFLKNKTLYICTCVYITTIFNFFFNVS